MTWFLQSIGVEGEVLEQRDASGISAAEKSHLAAAARAWLIEYRNTEDRSLMTDDGGQMTEDRSQMNQERILNHQSVLCPLTSVFCFCYHAVKPPSTTSSIPVT